jgi:flagellar biogenesis protein FliO
MADVHEHDAHSHGDNSLAFVLGIVLLVVAFFLFVYYLLPGIRGGGGTQVPGRVDVNLNQPR